MRITTKHIRERIEAWNASHTDAKLTYTSCAGYVGIGFLLEH